MPSADLRRRLLRASTAVLVIVLGTLTLMLFGWHQMRQLARAREVAEERRLAATHAREDATRRLHESRHSEARQHRLNGGAGARARGLAALREAAQIAATSGVRSEAIRLLAMDDLETSAPMRPFVAEGSFPIFDATLEHYVVGDLSGGLFVHRFADNQLLHKFVGLPQPAIWSRFSPDGRYLATRLVNGHVHVWDLVEKRALWQRPGALYVGLDGAIEFGPDGRQLAVQLRPGEVTLLTLPAGEVAQTLAYTGRLHALRFDTEGNQLAASVDQSVLVWSLPSGELRRRFELTAAIAARLHWQPGGKLLAAAGGDGLVHLFPLDGRPPRRLAGHAKPVVHVAFNRTGDWLASDAADGTMRLWEVATGTTVISTTEAYANYFSPTDDELGFALARVGIGKWRILRGLKPAAHGEAGPAATGSEPLVDALRGVRLRSGPGATLRIERAASPLAEAPGGELAVLDFPSGLQPAALAWEADGETLLVRDQDDRWWRYPWGRLAGELAALDLGWEPGGGRAAVAPNAGPAPGAGGVFPFITFVAVLGALGAAAFVWWHHRQLLREWLVAEEQVIEQQQRLALAQRALAQTQKMQALGTLAAGVAHDFNNLLSVIRMAARLVSRERGLALAVRDNVSSIERAVQQGQSVVGTLLGYSRDTEEPLAPFSAVEAVENTLALISRKYLETFRVMLELQPDLPCVLGSRHRLEQSLLNLLINAVEALPGEGELRLGARLVRPPLPAVDLAPAAAAAWVDLTVADNGPGIPPAIQHRVFEPFFTTKHTGARPGTGLGLATVYTLAQQCGWGLALVSPPGQPGACFHLYLPVAGSPSAGLAATRPVGVREMPIPTAGRSA